jgi:VanZ family protein
VKSFMQKLWQSRGLSLALLLTSILVFSYLFFSRQSLPSDIPHTDKYGHILVFFCLSILIYKCINIRRRYQIVILIAYGIAVECVQYYIPYRSGGLDDVIADGLGVILFYCLTLIPTFRKLFNKPLDKQSNKP